MSDIAPARSAEDLDAILGAEERTELAILMLKFDLDGVVELEELDGYLSAVAVAPVMTGIDEHWETLVGTKPVFDRPEDIQRARELLQRYLEMVQARVAGSPTELGSAALPDVISWGGDGHGDEDFEDAVGEVHALDQHGEHGKDDPDPEDGPSSRKALAIAMSADAMAANREGADREEDDGFPFVDKEPDDFDDELSGTAWFQGFRYAMHMQPAAWVQALHEEPELAPWLAAFWCAADIAEMAEDADDVPVRPQPLDLSDDPDMVALSALMGADSIQPRTMQDWCNRAMMTLPVLTHQLYRRHRQQAGVVAAALEQFNQSVERNMRSMPSLLLAQLLDEHIVPLGGLNLEMLDGHLCARAIAEPWEDDPEELMLALPEAERIDPEARGHIVNLLQIHARRIRTCLRAEHQDEPDDDLLPWLDRTGWNPDPNRPHTLARDWANAFIGSLQHHARFREIFRGGDEAGFAIAVAATLVSGKSALNRNQRLSPAERTDLVEQLPDALRDLARAWHQRPALITPERAQAKPGRNDPCHCGSGKKYKKCHGAPGAD